MLVLGTSEANHPVNYKISDPVKFKIKAKISIQFGRPKKNCRGFGLCFIRSVTLITRSENEFRMADGEAYFDDSKFTVEFLKESMTQETQYTFFSEKFKVEESFEIPEEILDKFKYTGDYIIEPGDYIFEDLGDRLKVKF